MKHRYFLIFFLIVSTNMLLATQCEKDFASPKSTNEFLEKLALTPYKKVYSVNDTIWVQFQTDNKSLYDNLSKSRILTGSSFLGCNFYYHKHYDLSNADNFFCYASVDSSLNARFTKSNQLYNQLNFTTDCGSNNFFFKVGFIPKEAGIYSIEPSFAAISCATKMNINNSTFKFIFDLADCNKDIWISIPSQSRGGETGFTDVSIDNKEIFVFEVR